MEHDDVTAIVEAYSDMVVRIAYQRCFNKSDSEDIAQEVFLKLMDHLPRLREQGDEAVIKAWLIRVTVNLCKDWNKSAWYRWTTPLDECGDDEVCQEWESDGTALLEALKQLRPMDRTIVYMYYYEGYKLREIAQILRRRENTVSSGLTRARKKLRNILTEGNGDPWENSIAI